MIDEAVEHLIIKHTVSGVIRMFFGIADGKIKLSHLVLQITRSNAAARIAMGTKKPEQIHHQNQQRRESFCQIESLVGSCCLLSSNWLRLLL